MITKDGRRKIKAKGVSRQTKDIISKNLPETEKIGFSIGKSLKSPLVIAFFGHLGAGKTTLIQSICRGLGIKDYVTSPSFTLINEYPGKLPVYHVDLYRLQNLSEIDDLGLADYFAKKGIILIEWAEKLGKTLPRDAEFIKIDILGEGERKFCISLGLAALLKS
ncbi:MAG: tRNA (adenosine(37)-N6)-threonylcarbamoyltransferase complex ATPase subunit type 1 TsaE [Candidatus Margulisbacteria bacterium]|nr:tRNA (adenosine(37)-N6)-threonylcarbamoyltransferase complex ATPase subunit type 1 TsaE [Candidatus Margulisiibacteriota bacterium]MBU1022436.1 tRNA (adenosine(37)-N6)-threonylcarbamoyltransferase complex ATPase subunit type 1 TsaE [Candidatus Margulisiibacteriota bacterium]MBU1728420.1 tRNA (adenosine(37)-N6)-threonylcarbamoyltransferase complex ATPase subunit type 1 TsaE [Candidatus Margulisiibacteriota bacterium]MBU1954567.1 tRNA (adenosine(37)-N6)-threonylcarbamoyltransferase complex ATPa